VQTLLGPLFGTGLIMYLESVLSARVSYWRLIEGVIFIAVIVFMPAGIVGTIQRTVAERAQKSRALLADSLRSKNA
jgi:branched-chain amino acid transport system permease protein